MKMKYERNYGNSEEYFLGSREHGTQFLGTWELSKSKFHGTPYFIFEEQGNKCKFLSGTREHSPPPPALWEALIDHQYKQNHALLIQHSELMHSTEQGSYRSWETWEVVEFCLVD